MFRPYSKYNKFTANSTNDKNSSNPSFDINDFKKMYPSLVNEKVPIEILNMYIEFAHSCVKESRYHKAWKICIGLFIAHFITLYLQSVADPVGGSAAVLQVGQTKGLMIAKSVDGVSVSYDFSQVMQGLDNWAAWKLTTYGTQFATLAKMYCKGGLYIY